eukprot:Skav223820  [mRNA]  locus=scaffold3121:19550:20869:- [translate_table: standard]
MYNVVEKFIRPMSRQGAGKSSWALLRHPNGLPCHVFITHAWAEGAYELVEKVLSARPKGAEAAWCCVLAMPQELNISQLIQSPQDSPFAKALFSASSVMAVANRKGSIYTRIWCTYEAFLASKWDKPIFTAYPPSGWWEAASPIMLASSIPMSWFPQTQLIGRLFASSWVGLMYAASRFRHCGKKRGESRMLGRDFISVTEAYASREHDRLQILDGIGHDADGVDAFIHTLLKTTIVTPDLLHAMSLGVEFSGTACCKAPVLLVILWQSFWPMRTGLGWDGESAGSFFGKIMLKANLSVTCFVACSLMWANSDVLHSAFIRSVTTKLGITAMVLQLVLSAHPDLAEFTVSGLGLLAVFSCYEGVSGLAQINFLGAWLTSFLSPGWPSCVSVCLVSVIVVALVCCNIAMNYALDYLFHAALTGFAGRQDQQELQGFPAQF